MLISKRHRNHLVRRFLYGPALNAACGALYGLRAAVPRRWLALDRPIFILGCSRSGTTVFIEHFRAHPDLCDWSEGAQLFEPRYYDRTIDHVKGAADATPEAIFRLRLLCGLATHLRRRSRFVNKHPQNSLRIPFLKAVFPDALFVHVLREGLSTIESNWKTATSEAFRRDWPFGLFPKPPDWRALLGRPHHEQFAWQWVELVERIRADAAAHLAKDACAEIRYEDFCADTRAALAQVDAFVGLDPARRDLAATPPVLPNANGRWRKSWSAEQVAAVAAIAGPLNVALGYPLKDVMQPAPGRDAPRDRRVA